MNFFERLFKTDPEGLERTKMLFHSISSGGRSNTEQRLLLRVLTDRIKEKYHLAERVRSGDCGLFECFRPDCIIALQQIEIFLGESILNEPLRTSTAKDASANLAALFILAAGLRRYGYESDKAEKMPLVRSG